MSVLSQAQAAAKTAKAMIPPIIASVTNFRYANPLITFYHHSFLLRCLRFSGFAFCRSSD